MNVSVIIPAHNAASTLAETLESLLDQTHPCWEAIIVDDGSSDDTSAIAGYFAEQDKRFHLLRQPQEGVCVARNNGIAQARFDLLLFLDADDWILPQHLERLTKVIVANPGLDAAYCGWSYVTPEGKHVFGEFGGLTGDLFAEHAQYCFSVIHTYLVRRALVESVGGFDPALRTCEDWDLWQRIARTGAHFGAVREKLALYRIRPNSATSNGHQLLADGLQVLTRGHSADPRLLYQHPVYPEGLSKELLTKNKFDLLCACAGYVIGGGKDARLLLEALKDESYPKLHPYKVARAVFTHAMIAAAQPRTKWYELWPNLSEQLKAFLVALEIHSETPELAHRAYSFSKSLMLKYAADPRLDRRFGSVQAHVKLGIHEQLKKLFVSWYYFKRRFSVAPAIAPHSKQG